MATFVLCAGLCPLIASGISLGVGLLIAVVGIAIAVSGSPVAGGIVIAAGVVMSGVAGGFTGHYAQQIADDQNQINQDQQGCIQDDKRQLVALGSLSTVASGAVDCINDAISNLANVRSMWDQYDQMLTTISGQLDKSHGTNIAIDRLYLSQAQQHWDDMVTFAEGLLSINGNVTVQNVNFPQAA